MRLAPHVRPVLLGLPLVVCQLALTVSSALAWETNLFRSAKSNAETQIPEARTATASGASDDTVSRWMNAQASPQSPANTRVSPPAAQQAAASAGKAGLPTVETNRSPAPPRPAPQAARNRRGPLFHGYEIQLPTTLFSRNTSQSAVSPPTPDHRAAAPHLAAKPSARSGSGQAASRRNYAAPAGKPTNAFAQPEAAPVAGTKVNKTSFREPTPATAPVAADATAKNSPAKTPAEQLVGQAHEWSGSAESEADFSRIIETCRRARVSDPNGPAATYANNLAAWALNRRGQLKAEAGRTKEALLDFDDAIRADAKCWRAIHNRGVLLAQDGQFEKAFDDFNRTIENNPEFAKAFSNRAALFVVANDFAAASQDYARAIELDPNLAVAHRGRGRVCHLLGKLDDAIAHYDAAVQLAPDDAYAIATRADLLTDLGRYADAAAGYDEAIRIDPNLEHAYIGSAWLLATCPDSSVRDAALAVERARISIELSGNHDAVSLDTLAAAQASAGDFAAATKSVRQAIELASPDERSVYHDRLMMYQHAKPYRIAPVRPVTQASYEE